MVEMDVSVDSAESVAISGTTAKWVVRRITTFKENKRLICVRGQKLSMLVCGLLVSTLFWGLLVPEVRCLLRHVPCREDAPGVGFFFYFKEQPRKEKPVKIKE